MRYFRFRVFQRLLAPFQSWARRRRMQTLLKVLPLDAGTSVLDLGGRVATWSLDFLPPLDITILNLPGVTEPPLSLTSGHRLAYVEGDACDVRAFADQSFAVVYSNSVIEHVGGRERRAQFAREVQRLGARYWVQTPSIWFPIEAHTGFPLWWLYPPLMRNLILRGLYRKLPDWTDMVKGTTVVSKKELRELFPVSTILVERVLGLPKSYIVVSPRDDAGVMSY